jgi:hypothetical protein
MQLCDSCWAEEEDGFSEFEDDFRAEGDPPSLHEIEKENQYMLKRQEDFRKAAEYISTACAEIGEVEKIVLMGSVASPLRKEVPRFQPYRRAGIEIWHECKDVDMAVWVSDLRRLRSLQRARSTALNDILRDKNIGVAHHQVDVFLMEPITDRYLGRLCTFNKCPKGKRECDVPGCGKIPFLQQHENFVLNNEMLKPEKIVILYERAKNNGLRRNKPSSGTAGGGTSEAVKTKQG